MKLNGYGPICGNKTRDRLREVIILHQRDLFSESLGISKKLLINRIDKWFMGSFSVFLPAHLLLCYGVVEFVLHGGIKALCYIGVPVIINAALGKNIGYLLPYSPLACTDRADTFKKLSEIIFAENAFALLHALIIKDEAFYHIFFQNTCCPYPELCCRP